METIMAEPARGGRGGDRKSALAGKAEAVNLSFLEEDGAGRNTTRILVAPDIRAAVKVSERLSNDILALQKRIAELETLNGKLRKWNGGDSTAVAWLQARVRRARTLMWSSQQ